MNLSKSVRLLALGNLLHGIGALILFKYMDESYSPLHRSDLQVQFWIVLALLMFDLFVNVQFLGNMMEIFPDNNHLRFSTFTFTIFSFLFRIEISSHLLLFDHLILNYNNRHIVLLSSVFFGYCLYLISKENLLKGKYNKLLKTLGIGNITITGSFFISFQLAILGLESGLNVILYFVNIMKYLLLPFVSAICFIIISTKIGENQNIGFNKDRPIQITKSKF